jgi:NO-binding membrane sensor protein with MHYT domain
MLELVERAKRGMAHWLMFASTSIGFFIWGLIMTLGFLAYPQFHSVCYLVAVTLIPIVGDVLIARVSDLSLSRKGTFF